MLHNFFIVRLCYMLALFIASKNNYTMPCLFVINSHFVLHVYFKHNEKNDTIQRSLLYYSKPL